MLLHDLLYVGEHASCRYYVSDYQAGFIYRELKDGEELKAFDPKYNYIVFVLTGSATLNCNEYANRRFSAGDMIFLTKHSDIDFKMEEAGNIFVAKFGTPKNVCDKLTFKSYWNICQAIEYDFEPTGINSQMQYFVDGMVYYLKNGINCEHFHELKQAEMFLIFRWFYTKEEICKMFYPIIGRTLDFKAVILENYLNVDNVNELARVAGMSRSKFDTVFKMEFGMPPGEWILKQKAHHIRYYLCDDEVTISDAINKFGFNSNTHFTRFCKQQFGYPPTEYMAKLRAK